VAASAFTEGTFEVTPDSITIRGSAGAEFKAAVNAKGEIQFGDLSMYGEAELQAIAKVTAEAGLKIDQRGMAVVAEAASEAKLKATASASAGYKSLGASASGSAWVGAEAGVSAGLTASDTGVAGKLGAHAGAGAGVEGTASGTAGGLTGTVGGGTSIGKQAGFEGEGQATYQDGVINFGLKGDLALVLGIKFGFNVAIDIGQVANAFDDVRDFYANDVANFYSEDAKGFFEDTGKEIEQQAKAAGKVLNSAGEWVSSTANTVGKALNPSNWW
jgi:hypothetical protein